MREFMLDDKRHTLTFRIIANFVLCYIFGSQNITQNLFNMRKYCQLLQSGIFAAAFLLAGFASLSGQMTGLYTVGGTTPDFTTVQEACDSLNSQGVSGAVTVAIRNGIYNENVTLDSVSGVSATNTVRFRSENQDSSFVTIASTGTTFEAMGDYLIFEDLTFRTFTGNGLYLRDGNHLVILDCHFMTDTTNCCGNGLYIEQNQMANMNDIQVMNSHFYGYTGLYAGSWYLDIWNFTIDNCTFESTQRDGLYMYADQKIVNLMINNSTFYSSFDDGIYVEGYYGGIDSLTVTDCDFETYEDPIYFYSDEFVRNSNFNNLNLESRSDPASTWNSGIELYGYYNSIQNVVFDSIWADSFAYGIYMYSDYNIKDIVFNECSFTEHYYAGIYAEATYSEMSNVDVTNCFADGGTYDEVIYFYSYFIKDINFSDDTLSSNNGGDGIYLEGDYGVHDVTISNSDIYGDDEGIYFYSSDGSFKDVTITDSRIEGYYYGIDFSSESHVDNLNMDNVEADGYYNGVYLYQSYGNFQNSVISNCDFYGNSNEGIYQDASDGRILNVNIQNTDVVSDNDDAMYLDAYTGIDWLTIENCNVDGYYSGIYIYNSNGVVDNVAVNNNIINSQYYSGIYFETDNGTNITFKNNDITAYDTGIYAYGIDYGLKSNWVVDSNNISGCNYDAIYIEGDYGGWQDIQISGNDVEGGYYYYGIYLEADDSDLRNAMIENNTICSGYGIYIEGDYTGIYNSTIRNNEINLKYYYGYGIEMYEAADNVSILDNVIDTCANQDDELYYGIYVDGDYNYTDSLWIQGNEVRNFTYYGIYAEYSLYNTHIEDNYLQSAPGGSYEGIYVYETYGDEFVLKNNEVYGNAASSYGFDIEYLVLSQGKKAEIVNNMVSGFDQPFYFYSADDMVFAHNSSQSFGSAYDQVYFGWSSNRLEIFNNLIIVDSANFNNDIFYFAELNPADKMDHNVTNIDTLMANYVYDDWFGNTYNGIEDYTASSGLDSNSFYYSPVYTNDTFNLRLKCNETILKAGEPGITAADLDWNPRHPTQPTIGADELLNNGNIFMSNAETVCKDPIMLDAGFTQGATYSWNTGATTQMISVSAPGTFIVTVTNTCGSRKDTVTVTLQSTAVAAFSSVKSFATVSFTNNSTGGNSYMWTFGDGNSSTDSDPVHIYASDGVYTVTLVAYGDCANDTTTASVTISTLIGMFGQHDNATIAVYPNPANGILHVGFEGVSASELTVRINNISGQTVAMRTLDTFGNLQVEDFDISGLSKGVYFVRIEGSGISKTAKIVFE